MTDFKDMNIFAATSRARLGLEDFLNFREKKRGGSFLFSKAYESLYRRRFKEVEDGAACRPLGHPQTDQERVRPPVSLRDTPF